MSASAGAAPLVDPASVPRLRRGLRLQWEAAQQAHVLLYPEGMVKLNGSAGEILARCDGVRPVSEIVAELQRCFAQDGLEREILAFLALACSQRWVELA